MLVKRNKLDESPIIEDEFENENGNMENYEIFRSSKLSSNGDLMSLSVDDGTYQIPVLIKNTADWTTEAVIGDMLVFAGDSIDFEN